MHEDADEAGISSSPSATFERRGIDMRSTRRSTVSPVRHAGRRLRHRRDRPRAIPGRARGPPGRNGSHDFFPAVRRLAAEPRVRVIDLTEWDPPLEFERPQRLDRGAVGRRVPCRLRDALRGRPVRIISARIRFSTHSHGIRRPSVRAVSRSMKLPGPLISATILPPSQWTSCTRPCRRLGFGSACREGR